MRKTMILGFGILAIAAPCLAGCFDYSSDCTLNPALACFWKNQGGGGTGGNTGGGGTGGTPVECVPSVDNKDIAPGCGVFVSSSLGTADGTGTQDKPFATLGDALSAWDGKPIYVCGETLTEAVKVESGEVTVYGALDCAKGWLYDPTKKSKLVAKADQVPLTVAKDAGLSASDFAIEAVDATKAGGSSVAVVADVAATVHLTRCDVVAGAGMDGAAGDPPGTPASGGTNGNSGANACTGPMIFGGASVTNACDAADPDDGSISGAGGIGQESTGGDGSDGKPSGSMNGGIGEDVAVCTKGTSGDTGVDGTDATGGKGLGELTSQGFQGADGGAGMKGKPGQGGGGGGGAKGGSGPTQCNDMTNVGGASGGSGGSGGCGGLGGKGGQAAGASIGLVSLGATLALDATRITTAKGGIGGAGAAGQDGGFGGDGGLPGSKKVGASGLKDGCGGGSGGSGGKGGLGGGGTGGHSLGIAFKGATPDVKGVTFQVGSAGDGGPGGNASNDVALHGDPGQACKTISFDLGADSCSK